MQNRSFFVTKLLIIATVFTALFVSTTSFSAEFSADLVQKMARGVMNGKVYVKGDNYRQEMTMMGQKKVMIFRKDKNVIVMLMPQNKMYMEMPASAQGDNISQMAEDELEKMAKKKSLGKEKVNGYKCHKYQYTFNDKSLGTMTQWISKKLNFPLKVEMNGPGGRVTTEYKNIKEKKVANSMFEIPQGYQKMSLPGMMRGMSGMNK